MKVVVAIYKSHEEALNAIKTLGRANFPLGGVSLLGKAEIVDEQISLRSLDPIKNAPVIIGSVAGPILGLLAGIGVFTVPGFGFLYGAGAIIGLLGGFDVGVMTGGLVTLLASIGIKKESILRYEESISKGNFLVIIQGDMKQIDRAEHLLHTEGQHIKYNQIAQEYIDTVPDLKELKNKDYIYNDDDY